MPEPKQPVQDDLTYEQQVEHLSVGYANAQSVVRFFDAKATAAIGIVPVTLGVLLGMLRWIPFKVDLRRMPIDGWSAGEYVWGGLAGIGLMLAGITLVLASQTMDAGFRCLLPRSPKAGEPAVLFPFRFDDQPGGWLAYLRSWCRKKGEEPVVLDPVIRRIHLFTDSPSKTDTLEDYSRQLDRMATIVGQKYKATRAAFQNLKHFLRAALGLGVVILLMSLVATAV